MANDFEKNLKRQCTENRSYFNEYVFFRCVENKNRRREKAGQPKLTVQDIEQLREDFKTNLIDDVQAHGDDTTVYNKWSATDILQKTRPSYCFRAMSKTFTDEGANWQLFSEPFEQNRNAMFLINEFANFTGLEADVSNGIDNLWSRFVSNKNRLPVSPYDTRFGQINTGGITWVNITDGRFRRDNIVRLTNDIQTVNRLQNRRNIVQQDIQSPVTVPQDSQVIDTQVYGTNAQSYGTQSKSDEQGDILDKLRPYMTETEFNNIRPRFNKDIKGNDITEIPHIQSAIDTLDYFRNNGIEYELKPDSRNGQIKCCLKGTKMDVRLVDVSDLSNESEQYIGRVYEEGISYYYKDMRGVSKTNRKSFTPDSRQIIDLVRYVRGESVPRFDGNGNMGAITPRNRGKNNGSYWAAKTSNVNGRTSSGFTAYAGVYKGVEFGIQKMGDKIPSAITDKDMATEYLEQAVNTARKNLENEINIEDIIEMASIHGDDELYEYPYSSNGQVRAIQRDCYKLLTGMNSNIDFKNYQPDMSYSDIARTYVDDNIDDLIGEWSDTGVFNPANTAEFMSSEYGTYYNNDELVTALRILDYPPERLKGANNNFYNKTFVDKLVKFDEKSAKVMKGKSPFMDSMFDKIKTTLEETGCTVRDSDILIDKNGIVQYKATQVMGVTNNKNKREFTGQIGQIFEPDGKGLVETKFMGRGDDNYLFVPGYEAYVVPQKNGENKTMEERTRLKGYEQLMRDSIGHQLRQDVMIPANYDGMGSPTSLNNTYSSLYVERFPLNYMDYMRNTTEQAMLVDARIETLSRRVRYSNELRDGSTINAEYRYKNFNINNDGNKRDPYQLTGTNMSLIQETSDGYFDPRATSTSVNQGVVRYLVESAKVNSDGSIVKGKEDDHTPLLKLPMCKYMTEYNAGDRVTMTFNNLLSGLDVGPAKAACMSFGGWTFDDGYVVSKDFANKRALPDENGIGRPLQTGDKISDLNGNKGVISYVVDPDMSDEDAEKLGVIEMVKWFRANPDLEVVGAPYAGVSRFNGGSAREAIANHSDLKLPDGSIDKGGIGTMYFLTTNMVVDEKTHMYGLAEEMVGKGRRISGQAGWVLQSKNARELAKECFGPNDRALIMTREMLLTMGLDINEKGELQTEYSPHKNETRNVFKLPDVEDTISEHKNKDGNIIHRRDRDKFDSHEKFMTTIGRKGGIMELPFSLKMPSGADTPPLNDNKTDIIYKKEQWERKGYTRRDGVYVRPTTVKRHDDANTTRTVGDDTYGLPIMSASLRSGQEFGDDGISTVHDYTREYMHIYEASLDYQVMQYRIDNKEYDATYPDEKALLTKQKRLQENAQASYDVITNDLKYRRFAGKHNIARDELMARRMPNSATAVWTADPRLDLNEVAMSSDMANTLDVHPEKGHDEYVLLWRDPLLRDAGMRYLKVVIDDNLTGVAINPVIDKSFDGDFDGDTVGLWKPQSEKAKREAYQKFSMEANMLDFGSKDKKTGEYKLAYHVDGLDLSGPISLDENLAMKQRVIQTKANEIYRDESLSDAEKLHKNRMLLDAQSDLTHEIFNKSYGCHRLSFDNLEDHLLSLQTMVHSGAKGNMKKLGDYAKYLGADITLSDDGDSIISVKDLGKSGATRTDIINTQVATSVKALGTGVAGSFSQRAVVALRNQCMKSALEVSYPVTQSVLQSKHNPDEARQKYNLMMGPVRNLWRGYKLQEIVDNNKNITWVPVKDNGEYIQATPDEFKQQFIDIYTRSSGLNVDINPDCVDDIAKALTDEKTGRIMNVETDARDKNACVLDKLAYGGTFDTWLEAAKENKSMFDMNSIFMPSKVRRNIYNIEHSLDDKIIPIIAVDAKPKTIPVKQKVKDEPIVLNDTKTDDAKSSNGQRKEIDISHIESGSDGASHNGMGED